MPSSPIPIVHYPIKSKSLHFLLLISSLYLLATPSLSQPPLPPPSSDLSFISFLISTKGLDFIKDLLVTKAISSLTPLHVPAIERTQKIPFAGSVRFLLSNTTLYRIDVSNSYIDPGEDGIAIVVSGATANLTTNWLYSYDSGWLYPIQVTDKGTASVQVDGLQVGLTLGLGYDQGKLNLSLLECGCYVQDIKIKLDGGASWFYQGLIDVFIEQIQSAVETAMSSKLREAVTGLNSSLQNFPEEIPIDSSTSLNVTFTREPSLTNSSIGFDINGLFTPKEEKVWNHHYTKESSRFSCGDASKMVGILLDQAVFDSASTLYFDGGYMQYIVDKIPDQPLLNTAGWRFIIPQLYRKYPNDDMSLNISLTSPPLLRILRDKTEATGTVEMIIDVLDNGEVIPVACISLEIQGSGSVKIVGNNLGGNIKLDSFSMALKWSRIGSLRMRLIQPVIWALIETVFLPFANTRLSKGFPLPIVHGFTLQEAEIIFLDSRLVICSDVDYRDDSFSRNLGSRHLVISSKKLGEL